MIKKFLIVAVAAVSLLTLTFATPVSALLNETSLRNEACEGINAGDGNACGGSSDPFRVVNVIINILSVIVGVVAVIFLVLGGFRYITSGGDSGRVGSAKSTIIYAVIGLIIVAVAQVIVNLVLSESVRVTG